MNFATLKGLTIPDGNVTQITDASGRVIWSGRELIQGSIILRPSADISVGHALIPTDSTSAYLLINEEEQDGSATYIYSSSTEDRTYSKSKFKLGVSSQSINEPMVISSVSIMGQTQANSSSGSSQNEFTLEINGVEIGTYMRTESKSAFDILCGSNEAGAINEFLATNKVLPDINIIIESSTFGSGKSQTQSGVTQVYVVLGCEGY